MRPSRKIISKVSTDEDVAGYLREHAPEILKAFQKEQTNYKNFRNHTTLESEMEGGMESSEAIPLMQSATPNMVKARLHWSEEVFLTCGLSEICEIVKPHLTPSDYTLFFESAVESKTLSELSNIHSASMSSIDRSLRRIRRTIIKKIKDQVITADSTVAKESESTYIHCTSLPSFGLLWWQHFIEQGIKPYHRPPHKPPVKAMVCDCGHHFDDSDRCRDPRQKSYKAMVCSNCAKRWEVKDWPELWR